MDNRLTLNDIDRIINEIVDTVGINASMDSKILHRQLDKIEVVPCIKNMARYLSLPVDIQVSYVTAKSTLNGDGFHSTGMAKSNMDSSTIAKDGITAQVIIPKNLPEYGSLYLNNYPIEVRLTSSLLVNNDVFIGVMAHELSHVLLHSLRHPKCDDEFYTDLTAMALGFASSMKKGRMTVETSVEGNMKTTHTREYGYLTYSQFIYAYDKINHILSKKRTETRKDLKQSVTVYHLCEKYNNTIQCLSTYIEYIDCHKNINIKSIHLPTIMKIHGLDYLAHHRKTIDQGLSFSTQQLAIHKHIDHYSLEYCRTSTASIAALGKMQLIIKENWLSANADLKILRRYIDRRHRIMQCLKRCGLTIRSTMNKINSVSDRLLHSWM